MRIDAHQHFWQFDPKKDTWITDDMAVIRRDFMPEELKNHLERHDFDGCVAVQADQSERETEFLLTLAGQYNFIKGVVGWVDLRSDFISERLSHFGQNDLFKGVRHILQAEPKGFMTSEPFIRGVKSLNEHDLSYDILTHEGQLPEVIDFITKLPEMRLVIDHISKPNIKIKSFDNWAKYMKTISCYTHVNVKLSGMVTEADRSNWNKKDLQPYIDFSLEHFGANRLMFGSDWPVGLLAGSYDDIHQVMLQCIEKLSETEKANIMGLTASKFYRLT